MLANNQRANEFEGDKKELNFDYVLEQLLSISKDSPSPHNSRLFKTSISKCNPRGRARVCEMRVLDFFVRDFFYYIYWETGHIGKQAE